MAVKTRRKLYWSRLVTRRGQLPPIQNKGTLLGRENEANSEENLSQRQGGRPVTYWSGECSHKTEREIERRGDGGGGCAAFGENKTGPRSKRHPGVEADVGKGER